MKWVFRTFGNKDGEFFEKILPSRNCNDDDIEEFDEPKPEAIKRQTDLMSEGGFLDRIL